MMRLWPKYEQICVLRGGCNCAAGWMPTLGCVPGFNSFALSRRGGSGERPGKGGVARQCLPDLGFAPTSMQPALFDVVEPDLWSWADPVDRPSTSSATSRAKVIGSGIPTFQHATARVTARASGSREQRGGGAPTWLRGSEAVARSPEVMRLWLKRVLGHLSVMVNTTSSPSLLHTSNFALYNPRIANSQPKVGNPQSGSVTSTSAGCTNVRPNPSSANANATIFLGDLPVGTSQPFSRPPVSPCIGTPSPRTQPNPNGVANIVRRSKHRFVVVVALVTVVAYGAPRAPARRAGGRPDPLRTQRRPQLQLGGGADPLAEEERLLGAAQHRGLHLGDRLAGAQNVGELQTRLRSISAHGKWSHVV